MLEGGRESVKVAFFFEVLVQFCWRFQFAGDSCIICLYDMNQPWQGRASSGAADLEAADSELALGYSRRAGAALLCRSGSGVHGGRLCFIVGTISLCGSFVGGTDCGGGQQGVMACV